MKKIFALVVLSFVTSLAYGQTGSMDDWTEKETVPGSFFLWCQHPTTRPGDFKCAVDSLLVSRIGTEALFEATLGFEIVLEGEEIIDPTMIVSTDTEADEECLTYEATGTTFEWQPCGGGGGGSLDNIVEDVTPQLGADLDLNGFLLDDTNGNEILAFSVTSSAVNHLRVKNNSTTNAPELQAVGDDTNVDLSLLAKGSGNIVMQDSLDLNGNDLLLSTGSETIRDGNGNEILAFNQQTSAVNHPRLKNAATSNDVALEAVGDDTNVSLDLIPKGSGTVKYNGTEVETVGHASKHEDGGADEIAITGGMINSDLGDFTCDGTATGCALDNATVDAAAIGVDAVGTSELDDDANTPTAGLAVVVEVGDVSFDYVDMIEETELDAFSELQTQISDKTLVNEEDAATFDDNIRVSGGQFTLDCTEYTASTGALTPNFDDNTCYDITLDASLTINNATTELDDGWYTFHFTQDVTGSWTVTRGAVPGDFPDTLLVDPAASSITALQVYSDGTGFTEQYNTAVLALPSYSTLPTSCQDGDLAYDSDATSGSRLYACESGTWTVQGTGSGDVTDVFSCASGDCNSVTVENGESLAASGSGTITATAAPLSGITGTTVPNRWNFPTGASFDWVAATLDAAGSPDTIEVDLSLGSNFTITLGSEDAFFKNPTNLDEGWAAIRICQPAGGNIAISNYDTAFNDSPPIHEGANECTILNLASYDGTNIDVVSSRPEKCEPVVIGAKDTDLATTDSTAFHIPAQWTFTDLFAGTKVAPTGATITVDLQDGASTSLTSTNLTIDATEKTSDTAATPYAFDTDHTVAQYGQVVVDVTQVGSTEPGEELTVWACYVD